jgi:ferritin
MKISKTIMSIINPLASLEMEQVGFYKQLSALANNLGFNKAAAYFLIESQEEATHFDKWSSYITGRGNEFKVPAMIETNAQSASLIDLVNYAFKKEVMVSKEYNNAALQIMVEDQLTYQEIIDFLKIQNDAIKTYSDMLMTLEGLEEDKAGQLIAEQILFQ